MKKKKIITEKSMTPEHVCNICYKTVRGNSYHFKAHLHCHKAAKPRFKCTFCSQEFFRSDVYSRHIESHLGIVNKVSRKVFTCDYCKKIFINKANLIIHLRLHDDSIRVCRHKCIACNIIYLEERSLQYHIRKTHFNLNNKEPIHITKKLNDTWIERIMDSEVCVQMTKINNNVIAIKKCDNVKNDKESEFMKAEVEAMDYMKSVYALNNTQYSKAICDYCKKVMLKKSIRGHIRELHLKVRGFKCNKCKQSFKRRYQSVSHICRKDKRRKRKL